MTPRLAQLDPVTEGDEFEARFEGLEPGKAYRVHILFPSGESSFLKRTASRDGEVSAKAQAHSAAQHVIEIQDPGDDHKVVATGHMIGYQREVAEDAE